jgi:hypothetical protein
MSSPSYKQSTGHASTQSHNLATNAVPVDDVGQLASLRHIALWNAVAKSLRARPASCISYAYAEAAKRQEEAEAEWKLQDQIRRAEAQQAIVEAQQAREDARRARREAFVGKLTRPFTPLWTLARSNPKATLIILACAFTFNYVLYPLVHPHRVTVTELKRLSFCAI